MREHKALLISVVLSVILIGGALRLRSASSTPKQRQAQNLGSSSQQIEERSEEEPQATSTDQKTISKEELAQKNGKDGHKCYVAVEGKVYEIEQGRLWKDGEHTTSEGRAHCGLDLTEAIGKSPHGKSKLEALTVVGTMEP